jgi:hypothetical protein
MTRRGGIDWMGLSVRKLTGWVRGSQCLARCDSGHAYGSRWCQLERAHRRARRGRS